jgi:hypothetical protein
MDDPPQYSAGGTAAQLERIATSERQVRAWLAALGDDAPALSDHAVRVLAWVRQLPRDQVLAYANGAPPPVDLQADARRLEGDELAIIVGELGVLAEDVLLRGVDPGGPDPIGILTSDLIAHDPDRNMLEHLANMPAAQRDAWIAGFNGTIAVDKIANLGLPRGAGRVEDRLWGLPVVVDPTLPPGTIEIRHASPDLDFFKRRPIELEDFKGGRNG